jgi:hypothetical protein
MANTTFSGPVRSQNGFQSVTKDSSTGKVTIESTYGVSAKFRVAVDNETLNTGDAVTTTLTAAQSGTLFEIDGTDDIVVNLPEPDEENVGITYEFIVTTAVGAAKTVAFELSAGDFFGALQLLGGAAANPASDISGDTLTLDNATVVNSRVKLTCLSDDGTTPIWKAETLTSPIATIA